MKPGEFFKRLGLQKLCEDCNWDTRDVRLRLKRDCEISPKNMSRVMRQIKDFVKEQVAETAKSSRITEFMNKLKGEKNGR